MLEDEIYFNPPPQQLSIYYDLILRIQHTENLDWSMTKTIEEEKQRISILIQISPHQFFSVMQYTFDGIFVSPFSQREIIIETKQHVSVTPENHAY